MRKSVIVRIPAECQARVTQEQGALGLTSALDTMGHIITEYFKRKPDCPAPAAQEAPFEPFLAPAAVTGPGAVGSNQAISKESEAVKQTVTEEPQDSQPPAPSSNAEGAAVAGAIAQIRELAEALGKALHEVERSREEARAVQAELDDWKSMKKHPPVATVLEHLQACPSCKPELDKFLAKHVASLSPDQVKALARQQKWWPPPPLELPGKITAGLGRT